MTHQTGNIGDTSLLDVEPLVYALGRDVTDERASEAVAAMLEAEETFVELCERFGIQWYLSGCLQNELVGLEEMADDRWRVHFGPVLIGVLDANKTRALSNERRFGVLVADGHLRKKRRRRPYRR